MFQLFRSYLTILVLNFFILLTLICTLISLRQESFKLRDQIEMKLSFLQKEEPVKEELRKEPRKQEKQKEEPLKIFILASHRTGSSLLGSIFGEQNSTVYFFEPLREVARSAGFVFQHWMDWPKYQKEESIFNLNNIYSCQYVRFY